MLYYSGGVQSQALLSEPTIPVQTQIPSSICPSSVAEPILDGDGQVIETYCKCPDGSYGFTCTEGMVAFFCK